MGISPMLKKQKEEWIFTGRFIRSGKLGLYIHEAIQLFKQTVEAASYSHITAKYPAKALQQLPKVTVHYTT